MHYVGGSLVELTQDIKLVVSFSTHSDESSEFTTRNSPLTFMNHNMDI